MLNFKELFTPDAKLIEERDALGFAMAEALDSVHRVEAGLDQFYGDNEVNVDGIYDDTDEADMFLRDALFESLQKFGIREGDDLVWRSGSVEVFRAPQTDVAEALDNRVFVEVGA